MPSSKVGDEKQQSTLDDHVNLIGAASTFVSGLASPFMSQFSAYGYSLTAVSFALTLAALWLRSKKAAPRMIKGLMIPAAVIAVVSIVLLAISYSRSHWPVQEGAQNARAGQPVIPGTSSQQTPPATPPSITNQYNTNAPGSAIITGGSGSVTINNQAESPAPRRKPH